MFKPWATNETAAINRRISVMPTLTVVQREERRQKGQNLCWLVVTHRGNASLTAYENEPAIDVHLDRLPHRSQQVAGDGTRSLLQGHSLVRW